MAGGGDECNGILSGQADVIDLNPTFSFPKNEKHSSSLPNSHSPTSASSLVGSHQSLSKEERIRRKHEIEARKEEQRRLQLLESQRLHELTVARQTDERKRKIEETRKREEARAQLALERRKEFDKQREEYHQNIIDRSRDRAPSSDPALRHAYHQQVNGFIPANMRASQTTRSNEKSGDLSSSRMTSSFTVAFGSSAPRSTYGSSSSRSGNCRMRTASAYRAQNIGISFQLSADPRSLAGTTGSSSKNDVGLNPMRRTLSQHFTVPTIAFCAKSKGEVVERPARNPRTKPSTENLESSGGKNKSDINPQQRNVQRRETPARSTVPKNRCNSSGELNFSLPSQTQTQSKKERPVVLKEEISNPINDTVQPIAVCRTKRGSVLPTGSQDSHLSHPVAKVEQRAPKEAEIKSAKDCTSIHEPKSTFNPSSDVALGSELDLTCMSDSTESPRPTSHPLQINFEDGEVCESVHAAAGSKAGLRTDSISTEDTNEKENARELSSDMSFSSNQTADNSYPLPKLKAKQHPQSSTTESKSNSLHSDVVTDSDFKKFETSTPITGSLALSDTATDKSESLSMSLSTPATSEVAPPQRLPSLLVPAPAAISASTTSAGEGGQLSEDEASRYRAKMAEQRRLARERKIEEQRRAAEEEQRRREEFELARKAAQERAVEEANRAREARLAAEARLVVEAQASVDQNLQKNAPPGPSPELCVSTNDEKVTRDRERLEALERDRLQSFQRAEEERAERKRRLESIMSRVKGGGGQSLHRTSTANSSINSLSTCSAEPSRSCSVPRVTLSDNDQFTNSDDNCVTSLADSSATLDDESLCSGNPDQHNFSPQQAFSGDVANNRGSSDALVDSTTNGRSLADEKFYRNNLGGDVSDATPHNQPYQHYTPLDLKSPGVNPMIGSNSH